MRFSKRFFRLSAGFALFLLAWTATSAPAASYDVGLPPFLSFSAAGEGMGNAVGSIPAHPTNAWTNPGGLAFQQGWTLYLSPDDEVSDGRDNLRDRIFSISRNLGRKNALGVSLILRSDSNHGYIFKDTDTGQTISSGVSDNLDQTLMLSYARQVGQKLGIGATVMSYQRTASEEFFESDRTFAITAGLLARFPFLYKNEFPMELRTGLSLANVGSSFDVETTTADLPLNARFSTSINYDRDRMSGITIGADVYSQLQEREVRVSSDQIEVRDWLQRIGLGVGGEIRISGVVALRAGYIHDEDIGTSGRSGGTFGFDVGHQIHPGLGGTFEYSRAPAATGDTADHIGIRIYLVPEYLGKE